MIVKTPVLRDKEDGAPASASIPSIDAELAHEEFSVDPVADLNKNLAPPEETGPDTIKAANTPEPKQTEVEEPKEEAPKKELKPVEHDEHKDDFIDPSVLRKVVPEVLPPKRDYTGLNETEIAMFKKMGNEPYKVLRPIFDEHKVLKKQLEETRVQLKEAQTKSGLPESWAEHPEAFTLTKDYKEAVEIQGNISRLYNFYQNQLVAIKSGEKWHRLVEDAKGNYISEEMDASPRAEIEVTQLMRQLEDRHSALSNHIGNLRTQFTSKHGSVKAFVEKEIEDAYFPQFKQAELDKPENVKWKDTVDKVIKALPVQLQTSVLARGYGKAAATILMLNEYIQTQNKEIASLKLLSKDAKLKQPSVETAIASKPAKKTVSVDDFDKELEQ